jgi:hypothetical protein
MDLNAPDAKTQRLFGACFAAAGLALCYFFDVMPYQQMLAGADEVDLGLKRAIIGPLLFLIGIGQGASAPVWFGRTGQKFSVRSIGLTIVMLAISFGVYWWLDAQFAAHGYS